MPVINPDIERLKRVLLERRTVVGRVADRIRNGNHVEASELAAALNEIERAAVALAFAEERCGYDVSDPSDRA